MNTLRDSRQSIHSIAFRYRPKSLCMNTLRNSSQDIHSIILRSKVSRTKELWGGRVWGLRSWLLTGFQRPTPGRARAAFAAPESGSGPLSLLFGRDSGAEENAPRKTKVTPTPGIARGYTCSVEEIPAAISQGESRRSQGKSPRRAPVGAGLPRGLAERWPSFH
jgi:hypothetical protein